MLIGLDGNEANVEKRVGSGKYAFELMWQFSKNKRSFSTNKKHEFEVFLKQKPFADLPQPSKNFKYRVFGPKRLWTQLALPAYLTFGRRPDIFFSMSHYGPRFSPVPYVGTIFDLSYLHYPSLFNKDDLHKLTNWTKYSIGGAKHILAISKSTKDDIVKNYGVDPKKITVTYIGYDQKRFKPEPKEKVERVKKIYKIKGDYLIFVGTLQPRKNIERLIESFSRLTHHSSLVTHHLRLVIVGKKGWMYDQIFKNVKQLRLEDKVIFTDYIPDSDLPAIICGAKVYVLPSLWEGFGIPVIEAQACGVPVVVSNVSSLPEVVGDSAILIDPEKTDSIADGIKKALNDKTRTVLVKKGFENVKRFSWEKCAKETLQVLESV